MTKTYLTVFLVLVVTVLSARAEDWTVNGKDYHNVIVGQVEADKVHITYDDGVGTIKLADLPPDLQKRFNYDSAAAAKAAADEQAKEAASDAMVAQVTAQQKAAKEQATDEEAVESGAAETKKHPLGMYGTISSGSNGSYFIRADQFRIMQADNGSGGGDYRGSQIIELPNSKQVLNGAGGTCILVTNKTYTVDQKVSLTVYAAGTEIDNGDQYARYSDDPTTAYKMSKASN